MNYFDKNKLLMILVVLLTVLNVGAVAFVYIVSTRYSLRPEENPVESFIEHQMNFTAGQKSEYVNLRDEHFRRVDTLMTARSEVMKQLFDLLKKDDAGENEVQQKSALLGTIEQERAVATYRHFRAIRTLCTPAQRPNFDTLVTSVLNKVHEPHEGPGPGKK
jgi:Spy/CpxP family protein refolding chaperone